MVKNKVLTPVLAGVLGLSIVGSGLGYYFVNKDSNDGKTEGGKAKLTQVADNINNTLGTAEKAIKGELDFAYNYETMLPGHRLNPSDYGRLRFGTLQPRKPEL